MSQSENSGVSPRAEVEDANAVIREPPRAVAPFHTKQAKQHQHAWAEYLDIPLEVTNSIGMTLVLIPPGEFMMGAAESDLHGMYYEKPQHRVRITKPFYLGVTEVTQWQWEAMMGTKPWSGNTSTKEGSDYAASHVNWDYAVGFCEKLSRKEGVTYRLPTEAEWEYACRAGTTTVYHFADDASRLGDYAWFDGNAGGGIEKYAHRVGQKKANPFGLCDMHGNVQEWCQDWSDRHYYAVSPPDDPPGGEGSLRVNRGGSWFHYARDCRSAKRFSCSPFLGGDIEGFRVARSVESTSVDQEPIVIGEPDDDAPNASAPEQYSIEWFLEHPEYGRTMRKVYDDLASQLSRAEVRSRMHELYTTARRSRITGEQFDRFYSQARQMTSGTR